MTLSEELMRRDAAGTPLRVAVIGAGKFAAMYLAQARRTPGVHVVGVADLNPERARANLAGIGWPEEAFAAADAASALRTGATWLTDDAHALIAAEGVEVVVDITGNPAAAIGHALACLRHGRHLVNVTVEADVLVGPLLARRFREADLVYSQAYGDQPALIAEMVDWARTAGFEVVAAGKGTKYLPEYHHVTPDDVWGHYGITPEEASRGGMNPQMFNSFLDGTKSAIEMAAVANACGLRAPENGLAFPPADVDDLPGILKPRDDGGVLDGRGMVEVVSCVNRDGTAIARDLRWGVYVVFAGADDYVRRCFREYGLKTDDSGEYTAMYKPYHLIGLELGISVAKAAIMREATGVSRRFAGDVAAVAKKDLSQGDVLDGEGGYTVYGKLAPAARSLAEGYLPIGLAHKVVLRNSVARDRPLTWDDVAIDETVEAVRLRREMEDMARAGSI